MALEQSKTDDTGNVALKRIDRKGTLSCLLIVLVTVTVYASMRHFILRNDTFSITPFTSMSNSMVTARPDSCDNCFKNDFNLMINQEKLCKNDVFLLIIINVRPSSTNRRRAIRHTWGAKCYDPDSKMKCLFVVGNTKNVTEHRQLVRESNEHRDILQIDFIDSYRNNTFKLVSEFKWVVKYCPKASYIFKVDEDMYINTELVPVLLRAAPLERFVGGKCWGPDPARRDNKSKWRVSFEEYPHVNYPAQCSGAGVLISNDVINDIVGVAKNTPYFWIDDVYLALCLDKLKIEPVYLKGFYFDFVEFDPCVYRNVVLTSHGLTVQQLYTIVPKVKTVVSGRLYVNVNRNTLKKIKLIHKLE